VRTRTNNAGGILGGYSTGMPIIFRVAIKPTPSIGKKQESISLSRRTNVSLEIRGRHDPCIVPRAVPCVEAVCAAVLLDMII
jgi:chorismate synthase